MTAGHLQGISHGEYIPAGMCHNELCIRVPIGQPINIRNIFSSPYVDKNRQFPLLRRLKCGRVIRVIHCRTVAGRMKLDADKSFHRQAPSNLLLHIFRIIGIHGHIAQKPIRITGYGIHYHIVSKMIIRSDGGVGGYTDLVNAKPVHPGKHPFCGRIRDMKGFPQPDMIMAIDNRNFMKGQPFFHIIRNAHACLTPFSRFSRFL